MTGWSKFRPLVFRLISAIRDYPVTLSHCSWFWNWNGFGFSLHLPLPLCVPKCSSKGYWKNFSKRRKRAFSVIKSNFPTSTNDFTKTRNIWWSWYLQKKLITLVDFEQNLHNTLKEINGEKTESFCSVRDHLGQFAGPSCGLVAQKILWVKKNKACYYAWYILFINILYVFLLHAKNNSS